MCTLIGIRGLMGMVPELVQRQEPLDTTIAKNIRMFNEYIGEARTSLE